MKTVGKRHGRAPGSLSVAKDDLSVLMFVAGEAQGNICLEGLLVFPLKAYHVILITFAVTFTMIVFFIMSLTYPEMVLYPLSSNF